MVRNFGSGCPLRICRNCGIGCPLRICRNSGSGCRLRIAASCSAMPCSSGRPLQHAFIVLVNLQLRMEIPKSGLPFSDHPVALPVGATLARHVWCKQYREYTNDRCLKRNTCGYILLYSFLSLYLSASPTLLRCHDTLSATNSAIALSTSSLRIAIGIDSDRRLAVLSRLLGLHGGSLS